MNLGLNINKLLDTIFSKSTRSDGIFYMKRNRKAILSDGFTLYDQI